MLPNRIRMLPVVQTIDVAANTENATTNRDPVLHDIYFTILFCYFLLFWIDVSATGNLGEQIFFYLP